MVAGVIIQLMNPDGESSIIIDHLGELLPGAVGRRTARRRLDSYLTKPLQFKYIRTGALQYGAHAH